MRRFAGVLPYVLAVAVALLLLQPASYAGSVEKTYEVKGFMCADCPAKVETTLKSKEGVQSVQAKYPEGTVHVVFDPQKITEEQIKKAIEEAGFKVTGEKEG